MFFISKYVLRNAHVKKTNVSTEIIKYFYFEGKQQEALLFCW